MLHQWGRITRRYRVGKTHGALQLRRWRRSLKLEVMRCNMQGWERAANSRQNEPFCREFHPKMITDLILAGWTRVCSSARSARIKKVGLATLRVRRRPC